MDLVNTNAQVNKLNEIRRELLEVVRAMGDYSAFDEMSNDVNEAIRCLSNAELNMRAAIRRNNKG